jgi:hypothetical protein
VKIFHHRQNTANEIRVIPAIDGVEIDLRSFNGEIILQHDPFLPGEYFKDWLQSWAGQHLILNIKEEGIEDRVLDLIRDFNVRDYFLLDQSFPFMLKTLSLGNKNVAARVSDLEAVGTALSITSEWVWLDCFSGDWTFMTEVVPLLRAVQKKICLVSPELVRKNVESELFTLKELIQENGLVFDGVCTKRKSDWSLN